MKQVDEGVSYREFVYEQISFDVNPRREAVIHVAKNEDGAKQIKFAL